MKDKSLGYYLFRIIPQRTLSYITRNSDKNPLSKIKNNFYKNSFFLSTTIEWNNLDILLRSSILKIIISSSNSLYDCHNIMGINLVIRLRLGLSHLREQKIKQFSGYIKHSVTAGWTSNPPPTFYSHVPRTSTKDTPSWATWTELIQNISNFFGASDKHIRFWEFVL